MARLAVLRRSGRTEEALGLAESLFHRAIGNDLEGMSSEDLLLAIEELGAQDERVEALRRNLPQDRPDLVVEGPGKAVRIIMLGGNEMQAAYDAKIEADLTRRYEGTVKVTWLHSGWSSNWSRWADSAEALYPQSDAVVLSYYVRTNLGRRIRSTAGQAGLPWVPCSGHGKAAITRAIDVAVGVARSREVSPP
jgi:hypothetical protein